MTASIVAAPTRQAPANAGSADSAGRARRVRDAMVVHPKVHHPDTSLADIRAFFHDDHVHMALVVAADGRLVTTIERADLTTVTTQVVTGIGALDGRITAPDQDLAAATTVLKQAGRRRLAVVDQSGHLIGLLCLKKDGSGFCSDESIKCRRDNAR